MKFSNIRQNGKYIEIDVNGDGCLLYDMTKFKEKSLPRTPPEKECYIPTIEDVCSKPVKGLRTTENEVVIDFVLSPRKLHICRDLTRVELYSTEEDRDYSPKTPYVIDVFEFK
jgi:hypothetical protein